MTLSFWQMWGLSVFGACYGFALGYIVGRRISVRGEPERRAARASRSSELAARITMVREAERRATLDAVREKLLTLSPPEPEDDAEPDEAAETYQRALDDAWMVLGDLAGIRRPTCIRGKYEDDATAAREVPHAAS